MRISRHSSPGVFNKPNGHVERRDQIVEQIGKKLAGHKCAATAGSVEESSDLVGEDAAVNVRDAGLIGAAQRVGHYEIAGYGIARALTKHLGLEQIAELPGQTLEEEQEPDAKLTELAESVVNAAAETPGK